MTATRSPTHFGSARADRPIGLVLRVAGAGASFALGQGAGAFVGYVLVRAGLLSGSGGQWLIVFLAVCGELGAVLLYARVVAGVSPAALGLSQHGIVALAARGAMVGAAMMVAIVGGWLALVVGAIWHRNPDGASATVGLLAGAVFFMVQGPGEEVLFRGYVLRAVAARFGPGWGIAVSSLLFGAIHALNPDFALIPMANLVLFGLVMAAYAVWVDHGSLWGVCAIHGAWNWIEQFVFGTPNSGTTVPPQFTLFQVTPPEAGPTWLWGGGFGPEGTLGTTIVLLAMLLTIFLLARYRPGSAPGASDALEFVRTEPAQ